MAYIYDLADTWNASGTTFTAIKMNVTDSASNAASLLMDLQVGGVSQFSVSKAGGVAATGSTSSNVAFARNGTPGTGMFFLSSANLTMAVGGTGVFNISSTGASLISSHSLGFLAGAMGTAVDVSLFRDAANTLAQRNGVNAQAFNLYNTYTDASNFERGVMKWATNVLQIGTEAAGTGTGRSLSLVSGGATYFTLSGFNVNFSSNRRISLNTGGWIDVLENGSAVAAPASDTARIYAEDNGSGKTRLMVQFFSGAAQQIAIEP
jgi:hypothetical protein